MEVVKQWHRRTDFFLSMSGTSLFSALSTITYTRQPFMLESKLKQTNTHTHTHTHTKKTTIILEFYLGTSL